MGKVKCRHCGKYGKKEDMLGVPLGYFCNMEHMIAYTQDKQIKARAKKKRQAEKKREFNKDIKQRKEKLMTRGQWYQKLQKLVNQYVLKIRDAGKPCCTCGNTNPNTKMNAGHYHAVSRGGADRRRFNLLNIHAQCEYCNTYRNGAPKEYAEFILKKYGKETLDKLDDESAWPTLKEKFPTIDDIKAEIDRYRAIIREHGLKPVV